MFNQFQSGTISNVFGDVGNVDELGACTLEADAGVGQWIRVASVSMETPSVGFCATSVFLGDAHTDSSLFDVGITTALDLAGVHSVDVLEQGVIYNLDVPASGDMFVGPGDFSFFAPCWLEMEPLGECEVADFDCDGVVGPGDLSFFATAWLKDVFDPTILVDPCQLHCPAATAVAAGHAGVLPWATPEMIESFGLAVPPADWAGWRLAPPGTEIPKRAKRTRSLRNSGDLGGN